MNPRFDPATYPGSRPAGPVLVFQGEAWPLGIGADGFQAPGPAAGAAVLAGPVRWSVAYGANANVDRLVDKALDSNGAILLPARMRGWTTAWESRRVRSTGAVPLTLVPSDERVVDTWVVGLLPSDTATLDTSEGRGSTYVLGRVGPVAVAGRWCLADALAYGPGPATRTLTDRGRRALYPASSQADAVALLAADGVTLAADPLPRPIGEGWPQTDLTDLPLFVYGTLQPGGRRWEAIEDLVTPVGPALARGTLVSTFYGYPAATFSGDGPVHGTLLRPDDPASAAALYPHVDRVEDEPRLFRRVAVPVEVDGQPELVWAATYEWNPAQAEPPGTVVADGRWT